MVLYQFADIPTPIRVTAKTTADNTSIGVLWEWSHQGLLMCVASVVIHYQPERHPLVMMYTVDNATATSATLSNLQCNTQYTISVRAQGGVLRTSSSIRVASLPARGSYSGYSLAAAPLRPAGQAN